MKATPGRWEGPVTSGFGLHLVFVRERVEGRMPTLADVRPLVEREFTNARRTRELASMYERMLQRYRVTVEKRAGEPQTAGAATEPARGGRAVRGVKPVAVAALVLATLGAGASIAVAHESRPGFLELRETGPETYSFLWKKPSGGEIEIYIAPILPKECRLATAGPAAAHARRAHRARHAHVRRRHRRQGHRDRRARIHDYRRHRQAASRRRPAREPRAQAHQPDGHARRTDHGLGACVGLRPPGHRAHPARRRPPALRPRPAA